MKNLIKSVIVAFAFLAFISPVHAATVGKVSTLSVITEVNKYRVAHHIAPLIMKVQLNQAAQDKAAYLVRTKTFAHGDILTFIYRHYSGFTYAGEDLAEYEGTSRDIVQAWVHSPTHLRVMTDREFKYVGVGVVKSYTPGRAMVAMDVTN